MRRPHVYKLQLRTGIAAANVEVENTDVAATTIHALLELDGELHSRLDFSRLDDDKVALLMSLQVLLLDEVCWHCAVMPRGVYVSAHGRIRTHL